MKILFVVLPKSSKTYLITNLPVKSDIDLQNLESYLYMWEISQGQVKHSQGLDKKIVLILTVIKG